MPPGGGRLSIGDIVAGAAMREDTDAGEAAATRTAASALQDAASNRSIVQEAGVSVA